MLENQDRDRPLSWRPHRTSVALSQGGAGEDGIPNYHFRIVPGQEWVEMPAGKVMKRIANHLQEKLPRGSRCAVLIMNSHSHFITTALVWRTLGKRGLIKWTFLCDLESIDRSNIHRYTLTERNEILSTVPLKVSMNPLRKEMYRWSYFAQKFQGLPLTQCDIPPVNDAVGVDA